MSKHVMDGRNDVRKNQSVRVRHGRAEHKNSHTGCLTCKQRRVKCDEGKPICHRCRRAGKECRSDPRLAKEAWTTTVSACFGFSPSEAPGLEAYADLCLQYFSSVTLPAFNACEPSSLWEYMNQEVRGSESLRSMAIALGHEHRKATQPAAPVALQAFLLYDRAVRSLRQAIMDVELEDVPNRMFIIVFECLLLVILQCFRKSFHELNIHLQHGLRIASQAIRDGGNTVTARLKECFRLLKQYSIAVALFNPLLPQATSCSGMTSGTANQALSNPDDLKTTADLSESIPDDLSLRTEEQNLVLELIGMTLAHTKPRTYEHEDGRLDFSEPLGTNPALVATVIKLRARHAVLERAIERRARLAKKAKGRQFQLAEARCMLLGIYLRCRWSGHTGNFDIEYDMFARVVDKIEKSLKHDSYGKLASTGADSVQAIVPGFSLGLDTIAPLFYVAIICRQTRLRWRAVELLSNCPHQEGPWDSKLAAILCRTIISYEEQKAKEEGPGYTLTGYIPEHCRIDYYYYYSTGHCGDNGWKEYVRVFRKQPGTLNSYTHENLEL